MDIDGEQAAAPPTSISHRDIQLFGIEGRLYDIEKRLAILAWLSGLNMAVLVCVLLWR